MNCFVAQKQNTLNQKRVEMLGLYLFVIAFWLWFCLINADENPITLALLAPVALLYFLTIIVIGLLIDIECNLYDN